MAPSITLRPIEPSDADLLCEVYGSTRAEELSAVPWSDADKAAFVRMQFNAQHLYYQEHYPTDSFQVILCDGVRAGRLYVARWDDEIRIVDIALLPEFRGQGIGTRLIEELFAEGDRVGKPVRIHVEKFNRALALYERLGFVRVEDRGVYWFLERGPRRS